jgi:hypothetical protein
MRFLAKLRASCTTRAFARNKMSEAVFERENVLEKYGPEVNDGPEGATQGKRE